MKYKLKFKCNMCKDEGYDVLETDFLTFLTFLVYIFIHNYYHTCSKCYKALEIIETQDKKNWIRRRDELLKWEKKY